MIQKPLFVKPYQMTTLEYPNASALDHHVLNFLADRRSTIKIESKAKATINLKP
jgi:hypothetical protein